MQSADGYNKAVLVSEGLPVNFDNCTPASGTLPDRMRPVPCDAFFAAPAVAGTPGSVTLIQQNNVSMQFTVAEPTIIPVQAIRLQAQVGCNLSQLLALYLV
jgi:hypothetical protein